MGASGKAGTGRAVGSGQQGQILGRSFHGWEEKGAAVRTWNWWERTGRVQQLQAGEPNVGGNRGWRKRL